jgi:hypothetical protein
MGQAELRWGMMSISHLQGGVECEGELKARGVQFSAPKHKRKVAQGKINLGTLPCNQGDKLGIFDFCMPETYDEFVEDMIAARERGLQWARTRYITMFGNLCLEQFQRAGQWNVREEIPEGDLQLDLIVIMSCLVLLVMLLLLLIA